MQIKTIINIESMITILIDSIETIRRLELLSELVPSFETFYTKKMRTKHFNELLIYLNKSEIIIELAYEHAITEAHENEMLFQMLEEKYRRYLTKSLYLIFLYDQLLKKSLSNSQLVDNTSTIFHN